MNVMLPDRRSVTAGTVPIVRYVDDVDSRRELQHLGREMRRAAVAGRAISQLTASRFRDGDEIPDALRGKRRMHHQDEGHTGHERDRLEVLDQIERRLRIQRLTNRHGSRRRKERVAVRRRMRDEVRADVAGGARTVVDDERCPSSSASFGVTSRVVMSAPAPGGNGTMMRTGFAG